MNRDTLLINYKRSTQQQHVCLCGKRLLCFFLCEKKANNTEISEEIHIVTTVYSNNSLTVTKVWCIVSVSKTNEFKIQSYLMRALLLLGLFLFNTGTMMLILCVKHC
jgi:hypothetical protein